jgi:3-hexulose-6-phosphate synthase
MKLTPPVVQIALDFQTIDEALAMAELGVKAGVDWLEIGTPLIVAQGFETIGKIVKAFPGYPVLADYKTMDSGGKNVHITHKQGGHIMTVCANSPDETVKAAVAASKETGVWVIVDTIGVKDQPARALQCVSWGVHSVYLHYGADQRRADASQDSVQWLSSVLAAVDVPVGVGCFGVEDAVRAARLGAQVFAIGHPVISSSDPLGELTRFVDSVKSAYTPYRSRS